MNQLRKVRVEATRSDPEWEGWFHGFGVSSEQVDGGVLVESSALVERPDGTVAVTYPYCIQFLDRAVIEKEVD